MSFLKRLARTLGDIFTSKKALYAVGGVIAQQFGAPPEVVALVGTLVLGQGIADHGKEAAKKYQAAPVDKNGQMVAP